MTERYEQFKKLLESIPDKMWSGMQVKFNGETVTFERDSVDGKCQVSKQVQVDMPDLSGKHFSTQDVRVYMIVPKLALRR